MFEKISIIQKLLPENFCKNSIATPTSVNEAAILRGAIDRKTNTKITCKTQNINACACLSYPRQFNSCTQLGNIVDVPKKA